MAAAEFETCSRGTASLIIEDLRALLFAALVIWRFLLGWSLRETRQYGLFAQHLPERTRGRAPQHCARFKAFVGHGLAVEHSRLAAENYAGTDMRVITDANLP